jgi:hypothetical protein
MSANTSMHFTQNPVALNSKRHLLLVALSIAGLANACFPAVFFSKTNYFGQIALRDAVLVAVVVLVEYAIPLMLILLHADSSFVDGYAIATASVVTVASSMLTFFFADLARWSENTPNAEIVGLGAFGIVVASNVVFLIASILYGREIHPWLHLAGFLLGILSSLVFCALCARLLF